MAADVEVRGRGQERGGQPFGQRFGVERLRRVDDQVRLRSPFGRSRHQRAPDGNTERRAPGEGCSRRFTDRVRSSRAGETGRAHRSTTAVGAGFRGRQRLADVDAYRIEPAGNTAFCRGGFVAQAAAGGSSRMRPAEWGHVARSAVTDRQGVVPSGNPKAGSGVGAAKVVATTARAAWGCGRRTGISDATNKNRRNA